MTSVDLAPPQDTPDAPAVQSRWQREVAEFRASLPTRSNVPWRNVPEYAAVLLAFLAWGRYAALGNGGRDGGLLLQLIALTLPAVLLTAPWKNVNRYFLGLAAVVPASAYIICFSTIYGFAAFETPATFTWAALLAVSAAGFARTPQRRTLLALGLVIAGLDEVSQGWLAWWGGEDPLRPMLGTFTWYNPFGAYCAGTTLIAASLALSGPRKLSLIGWIAAPFGAAAVYCSTSRGSLAALLAGAVLLFLSGLWTSRARLPYLAKSVLLPALAIGTTLLIRSPWVFRNAKAALGGGEARTASADQDLALHTLDRLYYMKAAVQEFLASPLHGDGFGSYAPRSSEYLPVGKTTLSPYVHNGVLQAFSEGGIIHGLPVLAAVLGVVGIALIALVSRREPSDQQWVRTGGAAAALALTAHALIDFDWGWPSLLGLLALTAALLLPGRPQVTGAEPEAVALPTPMTEPVDDTADSEATVDEPRAPAGRRVLLSTVVAVVALLAVSSLSMFSLHEGANNNAALNRAFVLAQTGMPDKAYQALHANGPLPDIRFTSRTFEVATSNGLGAAPALPLTKVVKDLPAEERLATVDPAAASALAQYLFMTGDTSAGLRRAKALADHWQDKRPILATPYVGFLYQQNQDKQARDFVSALLAKLTRPVYNGGYPFSGQHSFALLAVTVQSEPAGSAFTDCLLSQYDAAYAKYPTAPVLPRHAAHNTGKPGVPCPS